jgi:hypothetical protein
MFDMGMGTSKPMKRKTPETITISQCCDSSVTPSTPDDYNDINIKDPNTFIRRLEYICNKCGLKCRVKEVDINSIYEKGYSNLTDELLKQNA